MEIGVSLMATTRGRQNLLATTCSALLELHERNGVFKNDKYGEPVNEVRIGNNTKSQRYPDSIIISLHDSPIVVLTHNLIEINLADYDTMTTRERINQFLPDGCKVYTENKVTYLQHGDDKQDRVALPKNGWTKVRPEHEFT
jgi:hypothetical protein